MFFLTTIYFLKIKSELNGYKGMDSKTESFLVYKEKFVMSIKLFLIMGIPYIFRMPRILFQSHWIICDFCRAINILQGVLIFITFVTKRKVVMDLWKKFRG